MSPSRRSSVDAGLGRVAAGLLEHRRRRVDADDRPAGRLRDGDRDPPVPDRQLDQRAVRLARELDVEGDVGGHAGRPLVVAVARTPRPSSSADGTTSRPGGRLAISRSRVDAHRAWFVVLDAMYPIRPFAAGDRTVRERRQSAAT